MDSVLRAIAVYAFLLVFRISGRRTLAQVTTFDFVLLLIIGEAAQQALVGDDFSVTNAFLVVTTLILADIAMSLAQERYPFIGGFVEGLAVVFAGDGQMIQQRMKGACVDEENFLKGHDNLRDLNDSTRSSMQFSSETARFRSSHDPESNAVDKDAQ